MCLLLKVDKFTFDVYEQNTTNKMMKNTSFGILILRISVGFFMLLHGIVKLQKGVEGIVGMMQSNGFPGFFGYAVYLGEVLAPLMLIIGFRTRIGSLLLISTMLVAMFIAHPEDLLKFTRTGGWALELQGLYLFGALTLFFTGGGKIAVSTRNKWD